MSRYTVRFSPAAKRALTEGLPEAVAAAAFELITGAPSENPHRLGKQLAEPLFPLYSARRGTYRVIYRLDDSRRELEVVAVTHRKDAYRA
ncbi:type II toxin-antitoxin system RelE family toxin [Sinomonas mesophila]|uniref:type II toxin-antitoxin system RelE family toxin n=1 Tax=Sinomonas mesophila TaxID=1531955 RepID=UPI000985200F|nr:type II toxin-antitoxin system RelE/ParE family toxin [Sinomonas mesophila]